MPEPNKTELQLLDKICSRIRKTRKMPSQRSFKAYPSFQKRLAKAIKTIEDRFVSKYTFTPSGRVVWTVRGKSGEYQVIPETNFCNCDDFYFRVMGYKRQVCYHIIAQEIANALKRYNEYDMRDNDYDRVTEKWRVKSSPSDDE